MRNITDAEVIECAKKIKEYCAERAFSKCRSCALYHGGCFVDHIHKDDGCSDSYTVESPLDWEV